MKTLDSKIIKSKMATVNLKTNTFSEAEGQTIQYKGHPLKVTWGGEYYTAIYKGEEYAQQNLKDLKMDIRKGWSI